jgi:hypothetical protein
MENKSPLDYSKITEEELNKAEENMKNNSYNYMDLLKAIVGEDEEVGEE